MYIYILFFMMCILIIISYSFSRKKYLSPTVISSSMFAIISGAYILFYRYLGRDILPITLFAIVLSEISILLGEFFAEIIVVNHSRTSNNNIINCISSIYISKHTTIMVSIVVFFVALLRLLVLRRLYGGSLILGLSELISSIRDDSVSGLISFGPILSAMYYISLCSAYIYVFVFMQKIILFGKVDLLLLLPVFMYCICIVSTTSRTEFIRLACAFLTASFLFKSIKKQKNISFTKIFVFAGVFVLFFLWYGFSVRGITYLGYNSIWRNVVGYSCASIYGLDEYLRQPHYPNELFGKYTFEYVYELFGMNITNDIEVPYNMAIGHSNIYTSLAKTIQDFGIIGMSIEKMIISFFSVKVMNIGLKTKITSNKFFFFAILITHVIYIYIMSPIGEKASHLFFNPSYIIKLLIGFSITLLFLVRIRFQCIDGVKLSTKKILK